MTRVMTGVRLGVCVTAVVLGAAVIRGQQPPAAAPVNPAQVAAGRQAYATNCASCHRADLSGAAEAPALAGPNFTSIWGSRTAAQLAAYIQAAMPPTGRRTSAQEAADLAAFILQSNVASGGVAAQAPAAPAAAGPRVGTQFPPGRGLTVSRRSAELRSGDRRHAAQPARGRLADDPAQLPGVEPQPAHADHARQRRTAAHRLGVGDDRRRGQRTDPDRP